MYIHWAILAPISFFMAIFGRIISPILPFFVQSDGYLPKWLWWFQTPDNPCDGDSAHWERHPGTDACSTYKRRVAWFWRNVCYGFDIEVLGIKKEEGDILHFKGDEETGNNPVHNGYEWRILERNDKNIAFQLYFVYQYPFWKSRCIRGNMGWKLWDFNGDKPTYQWTGMIIPFFRCSE